MGDELDLNQLAKLAETTGIAKSFFVDNEGRTDGTLFIGGGLMGVDYIQSSKAQDFMTLFETLPRLIELCQRQKRIIELSDILLDNWQKSAK